MKHLRQYIRQILLTEGMKTPKDIGDMTIEIEFKPGEWIAASLWKIDEAGFRNKAGSVQASTGERPGPCSGAYEVVWANAEGAPGFGPMLYDIAMELAGDKGLMCDRSSVTGEAGRVWEYYLNNRPDVIAKQLDDASRPFLQDPGENDLSDDCQQITFRKRTQRGRAPYSREKSYKDEFLGHWATKTFVKTGGTPTLDELEAAGKVTRK